MGEEKVLASISQEEVVTLAQKLVRIPSENPPGEEKDVAEFLANYLEDIGLQVNVQEVDMHPGGPNVIALWGGQAEGPTLLLNGHLDVVPAGHGWTVDPYGGTIADGCLYGRGATDMKGPLAAMVGAVRAIQKSGISLRGRVMITAVVGEEQDQAGTKQLAKDGIRADFAIVGEPTGLRPVIAHKGNIYYDIVTVGRAAHAGVPHQGVNAIVKMFSVVEALDRLARELEKKRHRVLGHPTLSVGQIRGGTATNVVPDYCSMSVDRRLIPGETPEEAEREIRQVLSTISTSDPEFAADLSVPLTSLPMEIPSDESVVRSVRAGTERILGKDPGVHGFSGGTDATILVNELHIPTVVFGPGDVFEQAHKPDECIEIEELLAATRIFALTILDLLG